MSYNERSEGGHYGDLGETRSLLLELASAFGEGAAPDRKEGWDRMFTSRDFDLLLDAGFKYNGLDNESLIGEDVDGNTWMVWASEQYGDEEPGRTSLCHFYQYDPERGTTTNMGTMRYSKAKRKFGF